MTNEQKAGAAIANLISRAATHSLARAISMQLDKISRLPGMDPAATMTIAVSALGNSIGASLPTIVREGQEEKLYTDLADLFVDILRKVHDDVKAKILAGPQEDMSDEEKEALIEARQHYDAVRAAEKAQAETPEASEADLKAEAQAKEHEAYQYPTDKG